jgi:hypothetical protein
MVPSTSDSTLAEGPTQLPLPRSRKPTRFSQPMRKVPGSEVGNAKPGRPSRGKDRLDPAPTSRRFNEPRVAFAPC